MKKIQEEMIARFRERFVLDPLRVFFGDPEELKKQGWEVGKSKLIIRQDTKPEAVEAFLLEWSEKLVAEERKKWIEEKITDIAELEIRTDDGGEYISDDTELMRTEVIETLKDWE